MTKPIKASELGLEPHSKVRVVIPGAVLHLASRTEPVVRGDGAGVDADWLDDHRYGDTLGLIDWGTVAAVTWRWSP
jgi:hypothetical protein